MKGKNIFLDKRKRATSISDHPVNKYYNEITYLKLFVHSRKKIQYVFTKITLYKQFIT